MSVQQLESKLSTLTSLHKSLNKLAVKKTDIIKKGNTDGLDMLLKEERKHIQAINQVESERQQVVKEMMSDNLNREADSISLKDCLPYLKVEDQEKLTKISEQLIQEVLVLQNQNELNQELIKESLHFVNYSIDMLLPEPEEYNYERPDQQYPGKQGRSIFDSKA